MPSNNAAAEQVLDSANQVRNTTALLLLLPLPLVVEVEVVVVVGSPVTRCCVCAIPDERAFAVRIESRP